MAQADAWLQAMWPFVRDELPPSGVRVLEIGCGPLGGFVPMLADAGHHAVGVDPEAPEGGSYHRVGFEEYEPPSRVDAVVASVSLHHVAVLGHVLDAVRAALVPGGRLVVVEWASERFDLATARWCFDRVGPDTGEHPCWLRRHRDDWAASGLTWEAYFQAWRREEGLHSSEDILREMDGRFQRRMCAYGPYFFPDLAETTVEDERDAIDAGLIQATGIRYAARRL
jgi:SAM-dependent methyltransferase